MDSNVGHGFRDSIIVIVLTALLVAASAAVPLFSIVGIFVCGIPMACLAARHKLKFTIPAIVILFAVFYSVSPDALGTAETLLLLVVPGAVAGYMMGEKKPFYSVLLAVCVTVCLSWIIQLFYLNMAAEGGLDAFFETMKTQVQANLADAFDRMAKEGMMEGLAEMEAAVPDAADIVIYMIRLYMPSLLVLFSVLIGYAVLRLCGFFARITKSAEPDIVQFSVMKAPRSMSIAAVLCYLAAFLISAETTFGGVVANVTLVLEFILGVCGMSFIDFWFKKAIKFTALRWLIYIATLVLLSLIMLIPVVMYALVILGILDAGRNFRKLEEAHNEEF